MKNARRFNPGYSQASLHQRAHDPVKRRLAFKADAGTDGELEIAVFNSGIVGKAAEIPEHARIAFGAAEAKTSRDRKRHLVAAVRKQRVPRPAVPLQHGDGAGILHDAIGLWRIDLDHVVAFRPQTAETHNVFDILR